MKKLQYTLVVVFAAIILISIHYDLPSVAERHYNLPSIVERCKTNLPLPSLVTTHPQTIPVTTPATIPATIPETIPATTPATTPAILPSFNENEGMVTDDGVLPSSTNLAISDITFTIKTSHTLVDRWNYILRTWYQQANKSVVWITDKGSTLLKQKSGGQVVETDCATSHSLYALSCKTEKSFEEFMKRKTKWWCHMDDDIYVNTDVLLRFLSKYDSDSDVYLGRYSVPYPLKHTWESKTVSAWFGTGGGYCISLALALKMDKHVSGGQFAELTRKVGAADDVTVGFIINFLLHTKLTQTSLINTHLNLHRIDLLKPDEIPLQAMLSYRIGETCVKITAEDVRGKSKFFNTDEDPSRFLTIHCMIHPQTDYCQEI